MKVRNIIILSVTFSILITITGLVIYDSFINRPVVIFEESQSPKNINFTNTSKFTNIPSFKHAISKIIKSVVYIRVIRKNDDGELSFDVGSGFAILPTGEIVTNEHVIHDAEKIMVTDYQNKEYDAKLIGADIGSDIAVIKVNGQNMSFVFFGNSDLLGVGDWIAEIGSPFKLRNSVTVGVISALHRSLDKSNRTLDSYIQTDALANPGNSGGVLLDQEGKLIGMVTSKLSDNTDIQGFSFAIPSNVVKKSAFDIINFGGVQKAYAGMAVIDNIGEGALVESVRKNGAAFNSGVRKGDVITNIEDIKLCCSAQLTEKIAQYNPGDSVRVILQRADEVLEKILILRNNLNTEDLIVNRKDEILLDYGLILRDLTNEEKKSGNSGVYIVSIIKNSVSDEVNLEPGFFIKEVNGIQVNSVDEFIKTITNSQGQFVLNGYYKSYPGEFKYVLEKR
ncbi:MAG TPA: PDZ domain-containing protein [Bacteroidetes bacterium]|nr:PDZ domain-containing protein [Bacteroidota bacterium]